MKRTRFPPATGLLAALLGWPTFAAETPPPPGAVAPAPNRPAAEPPDAQAAPHPRPTGPTSPDAPAATATPPTASAGGRASSRPGGKLPIRVAPKSADDRTVQKLAGQVVRGTDGRVLGKVNDLLVDPASSTIEYAILSFGGIFGIGDRLRLVPFAALSRSGSRDEFTLPLDTGRWEELPNFEGAQLKQPNVAITESDRRRIAEPLSDRTAERTAGLSSEQASYYTDGITRHLVPAKHLENRSVYSDRTKIGKVETVVVEETARRALALFDPDAEFSPSSAKFLVPLHALAIGGREDRLTSTLTRDDLEQTSRMAGKPDRSAAAVPAPVATSPEQDERARAPAAGSGSAGGGLAPTGQTSAEQTPSAAPALIEAARAIRTALDRDPRLRELAVQVRPENGKLVLRGRVPDGRLIQAIEAQARRAAGEQVLLNELEATTAR